MPAQGGGYLGTWALLGQAPNAGMGAAADGKRVNDTHLCVRHHHRHHHHHHHHRHHHHHHHHGADCKLAPSWVRTMFQPSLAPAIPSFLVQILLIEDRCSAICQKTKQGKISYNRTYLETLGASDAVCRVSHWSPSCKCILNSS